MATNISEDFVILLPMVVQKLRYKMLLTYSISQNKLDSKYNMVTVAYISLSGLVFYPSI